MGLFDRIGNIAKAPLDFLDPSQGYKDAAHEMKKFWEQAMGFQKPYMDAGNAQLPVLTGAQSQLLNPSALLGKWMESYQESPYAKRSFENAKASGLDTASQMGLSGSSAALNNIQQSSSDIMNKDRDTFLANLMQKFLAGINIGQDIYGKGAATAGNLGKEALDVGGNMAGLKFGESGAAGQRFGDIAGMLSKLLMQSQMGG